MNKLTLKFKPNSLSQPPPSASPTNSPFSLQNYSQNYSLNPQTSYQQPPMPSYSQPAPFEYAPRQKHQKKRKPVAPKPKKIRADNDWIDDDDDDSELERGYRRAGFAPKRGPGAPASTKYIQINPDKYNELDPGDHVEEHIILRIPPGQDSKKLRHAIVHGQIPPDFSMSFHDNRRATIIISGRAYGARLVDLPTIIESQKTFDKKQFHKIADISQMLIVTHELRGDELERWKLGIGVPTDHALTNFPHGLSAPMQHVRTRGFRKRISKRSIEDVEKQVKKLLDADAAPGTLEVKVEWLNPDEEQARRKQEQLEQQQRLASDLRAAQEMQRVDEDEEEDDGDAMDLDQMAQELEDDFVAADDKSIPEEESEGDFEKVEKEIESMEKQRDKIERDLAKLGIAEKIRRDALQDKINEIERKINDLRNQAIQ